MSIQLASNFHETAALPLDDRSIVADNTARDAIAAGVRYEGLAVYSVATGANYQLQGGVANGDWKVYAVNDLVAATLAMASGATASTSIDSTGFTFKIPISNADVTAHQYSWFISTSEFIRISGTGSGSMGALDSATTRIDFFEKVFVNDGFNIEMQDSTFTNPFSSVIPVNTYGFLSEENSGTGGCFIVGATSDDSNALLFGGLIGVINPTVAAVSFVAGKSNGATSIASIGFHEIHTSFNNAFTTDLLYLYGNGDIEILQDATTSGSPTALTIVGGEHTTLTASIEAPDVYFNLAREVNFATGALALQETIKISAPTYSFVGASTLGIGVTMAISGPPNAGTNATLLTAFGLRIGTSNSLYSVTGNLGNYSGLMPGIANGIGDVSSLSNYFSESGTVLLGDQTATLTNFAPILIRQATVASTLNIRTITNFASIYVAGAPILAANTVATNGPYAIFIDSGDLRADGNILLGATSLGTSAASVLGVGTGTAPSSSPADMFQMYSNDITAGNAAPHFRIEDGSIIKLFKSSAYTITNVTTDRGYNANATTLDEIADVLGTLVADLQLTGLIG